MLFTSWFDLSCERNIAKEGNDTADIVRLGDTLESLDAERKVPSGVRLGEARHVGGDGAGRHCIDAYAALAKHGRELLTSVSTAPLVAA